jgi:hypothetical protein
MSDEVGGRDDIERELYWAADPPASRRSTRELRMALHEFAVTVRADELLKVPRNEPQLGSRSRWRRAVKLAFYTTLRPITHRYDRLLGELAILTRLLADRLADAEAEISRPRDGDGGEGGDSEGLG